MHIEAPRKTTDYSQMVFCVFILVEMEFPSSLTSTERAFIHRLSQSLGLVSKSKG